MAVFIETEHALAGDQILHFRSIGEHHLNVNAIVLADPINELIGFRMKARRIQGEYLKVVGQLMGQLNQCDVFRTAEGNGNVVVLRQSGLEDGPGARAFKLGL